MKKALILLLLPVLLFSSGCGGRLEVRTPLEAGKVLPAVQLSRGALRFKTGEETMSQFVAGIDEANVRIEALRKAAECPCSLFPDWGSELPGLLKDLLGVRPEGWTVPARLTESREERDSIRIYTDPDRTLFIQDGNLFGCVYSADLVRGDSDQAVIRVRAAGQEVLQMPQAEGLTERFEPRITASLLSVDCLVGCRFGDRDSRAGDTALSILAGERLGKTSFQAYFTRGNGDWTVYTLGLTQEEFLDLLLSILAQPEPEPADVTALLLEKYEKK